MHPHCKTIFVCFCFLFLSYLSLEGSDQMDELTSSIEAGDLTAVQQILTQHPNMLNQQNGVKLTPINLASLKGQEVIFQYLLKCGADLTIGDNENSKPLHNAAAGGHRKIVAILLESGVDIDEKDKNNMTAIQFAASWGHIDVLKYLLTKGADSSIANNHGLTILHHSVMSGRNDIVSYLIEQDFPIDVRDQHGQTPLLWASRVGQIEIMKILIEHGADINVIDNHGNSVLDAAIFSQHAEDIVTLLIDKGHEINTVNDSGQSLLFRTVLYGNKNIASILLRHNAKTSIKDNKGKTVLHLAAIKGYKDLVNQLLENDIDTTLKDNKGKTAFDYAVQYNHKPVVTLLEKHNSGKQHQQIDIENPIEHPRKCVSDGAIVWYLGHSGWAIKTQNHLLIFDYWEREEPPASASLLNGYINPVELNNQNVVVFVSHEHRDHYFPRIFDWRQDLKNITYIFGFHPQGIKPEDYVFIGPRESKKIQNINVTTILSNDTGVGFLVSVDGLNILHAGDHANRKRDFSGTYTKEIDWLAELGNPIDIAFFPVTGCGFGDQIAVKMGVRYAIDKLSPNIAIPMHAGQWCITNYQEFADEAKKEKVLTPIIVVENRGDMFVYENGTTL